MGKLCEDLEGLAQEMAETFDVVIIGAGPGGYVAAGRLGRGKKRVVLVESADLGGTCLNWGCIPTKALLHSSEMVANLKGAGERGVRVGEVTVDLAAMMDHKNAVVRQLRSGVAGLMKGAKVAELVNKNETHFLKESFIV